MSWNQDARIKNLYVCCVIVLRIVLKKHSEL